MSFRDFDLFLAHNLPGDFLKDRYPRGMRRLAEYGFFRKGHVVETKYGFKMNADRLDVVKWYAFYFGHVEPQISRAWYNKLQPGDHVLDIGGNVGYHALLAASRVGETGKVTTFEPSQRISDQLRANIALNNFNNVEVKQMAVLDTNEDVKLYFGGESVQGNSSTIPENATAKFEEVAAVTFDEVMSMLDPSRLKLIKIDVEGAEDKVLPGLTRNVAKLPPDCVIFVEISPANAVRGKDLLSPLLKLGFEGRLIENRYTPKFYRAGDPVNFVPLTFSKDSIHDVVLCRDKGQFEIMVGAQS
jgi:FkbM family methyltransferase